MLLKQVKLSQTMLNLMFASAVALDLCGGKCGGPQVGPKQEHWWEKGPWAVLARPVLVLWKDQQPLAGELMLCVHFPARCGTLVSCL